MSKKKNDPEPNARPRRLPTERLVVVGLLLAAVGGLALAFAMQKRPPSDPTRVGVERTLAVRANVVNEGAASRLVIDGTTNLPDGARIDVEVVTTDVVLALPAHAQGGKPVLDGGATGKATNGSYRVLARFLIEEQPPAMREHLHYQPRRLEASCPLAVTAGIDPNAELRVRLKKLIGEANNAKGSPELARVATDAEGLERELWLSTLTPGVRRLRRALETATRAPSFDLDALRRDLIEVDVLAGL